MNLRIILKSPAKVRNKVKSEERKVNYLRAHNSF